MTKPITEHEGSKYLRPIQSAVSEDTVLIDVYSVIVAFGVTCPARQHALKKLLCCGLRGKGDELADLIGVEAAVSRAIDLERRKLKDIPLGACHTKKPIQLKQGTLKSYTLITCTRCGGCGKYRIASDSNEIERCKICNGTGYEKVET